MKTKKINTILNQEKPDIVIVADDYFTASIYPLFIKKTFPMILERHSIIVYGYKVDTTLKSKIINKTKVLLTCLGAKSYDKVILLSKGATKEWGKLKNIAVVNNPLTYSPKKVAALENKKVIAVGRYHSVKGFDMLLNIWKEVVHKLPEWELDIYGSGGQQKFLQQIIVDLKLTKSVNLNPPTKNIYDAYNNSSIYAMTSRSEGFPLVLIEAMSCGIPVIAFDCPNGPKDIITSSEDGFLIPVGNLDFYVTKLTSLMQDFELRVKMGKSGRQNIARLAPQKIIQEWDSIIQELILKK